MKIINIVGARPNFMKIAPLMRAYHAAPAIQPMLVHTGQHYDHAMSQLFFDELAIPRPDIDLEVGSGGGQPASHAQQTAEIMKRFEPVCLEHRPDMVLVVGDVNSTIACALVAAKLGIRVAHVEAGLRSGDRSMPEEINRLLTDAISDVLFVSEPSGEKNLLAEGVAREKIHFVGNVMIDTLLANMDKARARNTTAALGLAAKNFALLTLHRPSNVDDPATLKRIWDVVARVAERMPVVFPCHPRTRARLAGLGLVAQPPSAVVGTSGPGMPGPGTARLTGDRLAEGRVADSSIRLLDPQGYLEFLSLMSDAAVVLTDSGGIQEETTILGVPCVTLRENTERPITCQMGTNRLVGMDPSAIWAGFEAALSGANKPAGPVPLWDGHAAERIVAVLNSSG